MFHTFSEAQARAPEPSSLTDRLAKVLPLKSLSDAQYESMLQEKLGKINVEISILDDQIADLKAREAGRSTKLKT